MNVIEFIRGLNLNLTGDGEVVASQVADAARSQGFSFSLDDVRAGLKALAGAELGDEALNAVAGGANRPTHSAGNFPT